MRSLSLGKPNHRPPRSAAPEPPRPVLGPDQGGQEKGDAAARLGELRLEEPARLERAEAPGQDLPGKEILAAAHRCRRRIMLRILARPRQLFQYLNMIHRLSGFSGMIRTLFEKLGYLLGKD